MHLTVTLLSLAGTRKGGMGEIWFSSCHCLPLERKKPYSWPFTAAIQIHAPLPHLIQALERSDSIFYTLRIAADIVLPLLLCIRLFQDPPKYKPFLGLFVRHLQNLGQVINHLSFYSPVKCGLMSTHVSWTSVMRIASPNFCHIFILIIHLHIILFLLHYTITLLVVFSLKD